MLDIFSEIKVESSVDKVARQLKSLINNGDLKPGDVLPSERKLAKKIGVGRLKIRDAIKKLEFYGVVKTHPQSGTIVKGVGLFAFKGLITDFLNFEKTDFASIVNTRNLLEIKSAGLAAKKRTDEDIVKIKKAQKVWENKIKQGKSAEEEDFLLHFEIAEVSGNSVLKLLMRLITPDIIKSHKNRHKNKSKRNKDITKEHREIVKQIIEKNAKAAKNAMRIHLKGTSEYNKD